VTGSDGETDDLFGAVDVAFEEDEASDVEVDEAAGVV
jgi:hypothetical protein